MTARSNSQGNDIAKKETTGQRRLQMRKVILGLAAGVAMLVPVAAMANGAAISSTQLPSAQRTKLQHEIEAYRAAEPSAFAAIRGVQSCRAEVYSQFRKPEPECSRELRGLGKDVLLPMLDALAFEAPLEPASSAKEKHAFAWGLLRAVGVLRDERAAPVLKSVFEQSSDPALRNEAAQGLGRLGRDAELAVLGQHLGAQDPLRLAAIEGLGECKRLEAAQKLANVLNSHPEDATSAIVARALGHVASSWAWEALARTKKATPEQALVVRTEAAKALAAAYAWAGVKTREEIAHALHMAEHPNTQALLAQARASADSRTAPAYDALAARLARRMR